MEDNIQNNTDITNTDIENTAETNQTGETTLEAVTDEVCQIETENKHKNFQLDLTKIFPFTLDDFQLEAIDSIENGRSVIVCAPTGSGKTVVAEYAVERALSQKQRCFYTTPLKALSNQKFGDFRKKYGDDMVGLLTGDTSVNRNANIVVMTTEVYRNMLYGTVLGDVSNNLAHVQSVIIDECHYMNDPDRGTVWEELVIYSPPEIQLIALSATVANADDLCNWFKAIHGPTDLVQSSYRPVPLSHNYYVDGKIYKLFNKNGRINPRLKKAVDDKEKRAADRQQEHNSHSAHTKGRAQLPPQNKRKDFPEDVVKQLDNEDMLPAIYFLFSRKKCDEAAKRSDSAVNLSWENRKALNEAIDNAIIEHPALAENPQMLHLRNGVAAHHAGLLPLWKVLVENLFQQGLIKVVYATETLAAGINMPARTTVISAISKYSDEGLRRMTASEFLQMSGRAGRRGMDKLGHVVVVNHPFEPLENAALLVKSPADALVSRFTPAYGMVLNLLQCHTPEESRLLLEKSFGQYIAEHNKGSLDKELDSINKLLNDYVECPSKGQKGNYGAWRKAFDIATVCGKQYNTTRKGVSKNDGEIHKQLEKLKVKRDEARSVANASPCSKCELRGECSKARTSKNKLTKRRDQLEGLIELSKTSYWRQFQNLEKVLEKTGYIENHKPTSMGQTASGLRSTNIFFLAEIAFSGILDDLHPAEIAGVLSSLVVGDSRATLDICMRPSCYAEKALDAVTAIASSVESLQKRNNVNVPVFINSIFSGLIEFWCRGADWDHIKQYLGTEEGDLIRAMRRTLDLIRQFIHAPHMAPHLVELCTKAEELLDRDEVHEAVIWVD